MSEAKKPSHTDSKSEKLDKLFKDLQDKKFRVKNDAIKALARMKHSKAQEKLYEIAESRSWNHKFRVSALNSLAQGKKNERFTKILKKLVGNTAEEREIRRTCMTHLSRLRDPGNLKIFSQMLDDDYRFLRFWAVRGILKLDSPKAIPVLVKAMGDSDEEIRKDVQAHLERLGVKALPSLIKAFKDPDAKKFLRYGVMGLLGRIKHNDALPPLVAALNDGNPRVVTIAIRGLGKSDNGRAIKPLIEAYKTNKEKRRLIEDSIYRIGIEQREIVMAALIDILDDKEEDVRNLAQNLFEKMYPDSLFLLQDLYDDGRLEDPLKSNVVKAIKVLQAL